MKKTSIAYIVHSLHAGGIERCIINLANHLPRDQFRPFIISLTDIGEFARNANKDVALHALNKKPGYVKGFATQLAEILREEDIDIIHSHNWGTEIESVLSRRYLPTIKHVHTEHGQGLHQGISHLKAVARGIVSRWAYKRLNALCTCSQSTIPLVAARHGIAVEQVEFLPNGVPDISLEPFSDIEARKLKTKLQIPEKAKVIGSVGRLVEVKGFELLIESLALLNKETDTYLIIVGDGPHSLALQKCATECDVKEKVRFVGHQNRISPYLKLFDLYINSSHSEAMSLGILEAMACSKPIIATHVGDNASLIDGDFRCGKIITERNPALLAQKCNEILLNNELHQQYSNNSRRGFTKNYSIEAMTKRHLKLYARSITS